MDAWWLDTDEPETEGQRDNILVTNKVALGQRRALRESVSADDTTGGVSRASAGSSDKKRVFILSRSAYAGAQRNSVHGVVGRCASELGDALQRQIPAGLNYPNLRDALLDDGHRRIHLGGNLDDPKFRELFVRWFQFGTFSPDLPACMERAATNQNELWSYGPEAQKILVDYDTLRYRLLPYIYSVAWQVTNHHGTR